MDRYGRRRDEGGLVFGVIVLLVGGYFLLRNTFGLSIPDINWDQVWPVAILLLGVLIIYRAMSSNRKPGAPG